MTRWPVRRGSEPASFSATGRGERTGQKCCILCSVSTPSNLVFATVSSIVYEPLDARKVRVPIVPGLSMTLCVIIEFSGTMPMMSPPETGEPTLRAVGVNDQPMSLSSAATEMPRGM